MKKQYTLVLDSPYSDFLEKEKNGRMDYVDTIRNALDKIMKEVPPHENTTANPEPAQ